MGKSESVTDNNVGIKQSKRGMGWCEKYLRYLAAGKAKISGPALEHCADYINSAEDYIHQLEETITNEKAKYKRLLETASILSDAVDEFEKEE